MVTISLETYVPSQETRELSVDELDEAFHRLSHFDPVTLSCEDDDAQRFLMIAIEEDYALPTFLYDGTAYLLDASDEEGTREISIAGSDPTEYPKRHFIPREESLELLRRAYSDMDAVFSSYNWIPDEGQH